MGGYIATIADQPAIYRNSVRKRRNRLCAITAATPGIYRNSVLSLGHAEDVGARIIIHSRARNLKKISTSDMWAGEGEVEAFYLEFGKCFLLHVPFVAWLSRHEGVKGGAELAGQPSPSHLFSSNFPPVYIIHVAR